MRTVALAALALCVCALLVGTRQLLPTAADELYLQVPVKLAGLSAGTRDFDVLRATMLATAGTSSSVLDARKEQVEVEDSAETSADEEGADGEDSADAKARRARERDADDARGDSSASGNDEDAEGSPPDDVDVDADAFADAERGVMNEDEDEGADEDDGYVHDIDVAPGHSLATSMLKKKGKSAAKATIKAYDPTATASLTTSSEHSGQCRRMNGKTLEYLRDQSGPWCNAYQGLTNFKVVGCGGNKMKTTWHCAYVGKALGSQSHYYRTSCQHMRYSKTELLDRQHVRCPEGQVMNNFRYISSGCWWHQGRYEFRCRTAETAPEVHRDSKCTHLRGQTLEYLDRQRPGCEKNEFITGFHLHSAGCPHNHMRYRTYCAKVYQPWWAWGQQQESHFGAEKTKYWKEYSKKLAEYQGLTMPMSMSGQRVKKKYSYYRKMYDHYKNAYSGVANEREAIKYDRLWRRYKRYATKSHEASVYKQNYNHYHNLYLKASGNPPKEPKATYPAGAFLGPAKKEKDKSQYWLRIYQDPPNSDVEAKHNPKTIRAHIPVVKKLPKADCGKGGCRQSAQAIFSEVNAKLDGLLPHDPDWSSYPKSLVRDPTTKKAVLDKALNMDVEDPIDNADIFSKYHDDGKAVAEATGCDLGDEDCLRKLGVWPGQVPSKKGAVMQTMTGPGDVFSTYQRAAKQLGDLVPGDPNWAKYPKSLVQSRKATAYKVKMALDTKVNDPLDNADYGIVDGLDASPKVDEFRRELRAHTGCDVGELDCMNKFLLTKGVPAPAPLK